MTVNIPAQNYISHPSRTTGDIRNALELLRDAIESIDNSQTSGSSSIATLTAAVNAAQSTLAGHTGNNTIHVTSQEKAKLTAGALYISTQVEFDAYFTGDAITNKTIYLVYTGTPYILHNTIPVQSNINILSDPGVIIQRGVGQFRFTAVGTSGNILRNIYLSPNLTFNGDAGVTGSGLGGSTVITGDGGFFRLSYVQDSKFLCNVTNSRVTGNGGAYSCDNTENLDFANVYYNQANGNGGGIYNANKSTVRNVHHNTAVNGGGVYSCYFCDVSEINNNTATTQGGGIHTGFNSVCSRVSGNTALQGGGFYSMSYCEIKHCRNNTAAGSGGSGSLLSTGSYNNISTCNNNNLTTTGMTGGVIVGSINSIIDNIFGNTSTTTNLAVVSGCNDSIISNITGSNVDRGVSSCLRSIISNVSNFDIGVTSSHNSHISNVHDCASRCVSTCDNCKITNIKTAPFGVHSCTKSDIDTVYDCTSGVVSCNHSVIKNITTCSANGVLSCAWCSISRVYQNTLDGISTCTNCSANDVILNGGYGITSCSAMYLYGNIRNNTTGNVNACTNSGGFFFTADLAATNTGPIANLTGI